MPEAEVNYYHPQIWFIMCYAKLNQALRVTVGQIMPCLLCLMCRISLHIISHRVAFRKIASCMLPNGALQAFHPRNGKSNLVVFKSVILEFSWNVKPSSVPRILKQRTSGDGPWGLFLSLNKPFSASVLHWKQKACNGEICFSIPIQMFRAFGHWRTWKREA